MDEALKSFFVELGFTSRDADRAKVENSVKTTEAAITKAGADESAKRLAGEQATATKRAGLVETVGRILVSAEQDRADRSERIRKDEAGKDEKLQAERAKKARERRAVALKELQDGAVKMAAFALETVAAVEATALGIVYATDRAAQSFERLNYAATRSGSSAKGMTAISYAFSQLGGNAEDGNAVVGAVGNKLKYNAAGYESVLKSIGVQARDAKGNLRDASDITVDIGEALARIKQKGGPVGYATALGYAKTFDIDEGRAQTMMDSRFRGMAAEQQGMDAKAGTDRNAAASGGTAFEQSLRRLEAMADTIRTKVETNLFTALTPQLDALGKWANEHGDRVAEVIGHIADDIIRLAKYAIEQLSKVDWDATLKRIEEFAKSFDSLSTKYFGKDGPLIATFAVFGSMLTLRVLGPLNAIISAMKAVGSVPLTGALAGLAGANVLADNALDPNASSSSMGWGEAGVEFLDPGLHDRIYGKTGEQQLQGPHHGVGVHAQPKDNRNLWQRTMPKALGGKDAPMAVSPDLTPEAKALLDTIAGTESPGYNVEYGGSRFSSYADHPRNPHVIGSGPNAGRTSDAAGRYQFLSRTWDGIAKEHGLTDFSPGNQDKGAWFLAQRDYRLHTGRNLSDDVKSKDPSVIAGIGRALHGTWTSLPGGIEAGTNEGKFAAAFNHHLSREAGKVSVATVPAAAIGDQAALDAQQRITAGKARQGDDALVTRYRQQQNTPDIGRIDRAKASDAPIRVDVVRQPLDPARQKLADAMKADAQRLQSSHQRLVDLAKSGHLDASHMMRLGHHTLISPSARTSINNASNRQVSMTHSPTFNIHGGDARSLFADAQRSSSRGQADLIRNMSCSEV